MLDLSLCHSTIILSLLKGSQPHGKDISVKMLSCLDEFLSLFVDSMKSKLSLNGTETSLCMVLVPLLVNKAVSALWKCPSSYL